jgi:hypothetical protein
VGIIPAVAFLYTFWELGIHMQWASSNIHFASDGIDANGDCGVEGRK